MTDTLILHDGDVGNVAAGANHTIIRLWDEYAPELATAVWREVKIVVGDISKLQGVVAFVRQLGRTTRLSIEVRETVSIGLLHGPIGPVDGRQVASLSREQEKGTTTLRVRLGHHAAIWAFISSTLSAPLSLHSGLGPGTRLGLGREIDPGWLGLSSDASHLYQQDLQTADLENPGPLPKVDLAIVDAARSEVGSSLPPHDPATAHAVSAVSTQRPVWRELARAVPAVGAPVETRIFNPVGVVRAPTAGWVYLRPDVSGSTLACDEEGRVVAQFGEVTAGLVAALRPYWGVVESGAAFSGPVSRAESLTRLVASGTPLVSPDAFTTLRGWIPDGLFGGIESSTSTVEDSEARERIIIRQVRSAHRFATWRSDAYEAQRGLLYREPSVSVGVATMRPEYLEHVLDTFEAQTWPRKQLLLGLHGFALSDVSPDTRRRVNEVAIVVEWPADALFGELLRELTVRAEGDLFAKLDDDDWYASYHLEDLVHALQYSGASLVGSGVQFVYMHSADMTVRRSIDQSYRYGGHPGGPTFMAPRDTMLRAGSWPRVRRAVDTGFNDAVLALGGSVYQSHAHNFLFNRRSSGHTWKASNAYFIEKARMSWAGIRPPLGFEGSPLPNLSWRSSASTVGTLARATSLARPAVRSLDSSRSVPSRLGDARRRRP